MEQFLQAASAGLSPAALAVAVAVTLFAGFVKGALGFAMPMVMISGLAAVMPPQLALAALILPTLVTNVQQAFRHGLRPAWESLVKYRRMIGMTLLFILVSAQFVVAIPAGLLLGLLGVPVTAFALWQLMGRELRLTLRHRNAAEYALGIVGGLYGGISGVWGPPLIVYLVSVGAEKREMIRVQGVVFLLGGVVLLLAHLQSGLVTAATWPLSAALVVPAILGMALGFRLQDRLDPLRFRRWTLVLLALNGLNLLRTAIWG